MSTLTYVYEDSTAVLGPLSRSSEPHAYDLCGEHAPRLTAPRGWELMRVAGGDDASDDLVALADAVRAGRRSPGAVADDRTAASSTSPSSSPRTGARASHGARAGAEDQTGRHLHVLRSTHD